METGGHEQKDVYKGGSRLRKVCVSGGRKEKLMKEAGEV